MVDCIAEGRGAPEDDSALGHNIRTQGGSWHTAEGFAELVETLLRAGDTAVTRPSGWVHCSTYWWAEGNEFLGSIRIRHRLTPQLLELAGHIGYDLASRARRQGHGTAMLRAALPIAAGLGIDSALLTCDSDNIASARHRGERRRARRRAGWQAAVLGTRHA